MFYYDSKQFNNLSRKDFVDYLNAEGIPAFICFPVLSETTFFKNKDFCGKIKNYANSEKIPNARKIANEVVWLPHYTLLGDENDLKEIALAISKIQNFQIDNRG